MSQKKKGEMRSLHTQMGSIMLCNPVTSITDNFESGFPVPTGCGTTASQIQERDCQCYSLQRQLIAALLLTGNTYHVVSDGLVATRTNPNAKLVVVGQLPYLFMKEDDTSNTQVMAYGCSPADGEHVSTLRLTGLFPHGPIPKRNPWLRRNSLTYS